MGEAIRLPFRDREQPDEEAPEEDEEDRLARVLGPLGIPSREDLRELTQRIDALQAQLEELGRAQNPPRS